MASTITVKDIIDSSFRKFIGTLEHIVNTRATSHPHYLLADYWRVRDKYGKMSIENLYTRRMTVQWETQTVCIDRYGELDKKVVVDVMLEAMNDHRDRRSPPLTPPRPPVALSGHSQAHTRRRRSSSPSDIIPGEMDL